MERTLTVTWDDPVELGRQARAMAGLEFLEAIRDGDGRLLAHGTSTCLIIGG